MRRRGREEIFEKSFLSFFLHPSCLRARWWLVGGKERARERSIPQCQPHEVRRKKGRKRGRGGNKKHSRKAAKRMMTTMA